MHGGQTLLFVAGVSPQIITETVWTLRDELKPRSRITVLTTSEGQRTLVSQLFGKTGGCCVVRPAIRVVPPNGNGVDLQRSSLVVFQTDKPRIARTAPERTGVDQGWAGYARKRTSDPGWQRRQPLFFGKIYEIYILLLRLADRAPVTCLADAAKKREWACSFRRHVPRGAQAGHEQTARAVRAGSMR